MNREIKFRVWDKGLKQFLPYPCFFNHLDFNEFTCFDRCFKSDEEDIIVQQFTGFQDFNNKDIYEGDIIRIWMGGCRQDNPYIVRDMRELYFECNREDSYFRITKIEIVGNIFETSKLLNHTESFKQMGNENPWTGEAGDGWPQ